MVSILHFTCAFLASESENLCFGNIAFCGVTLHLSKMKGSRVTWSTHTPSLRHHLFIVILTLFGSLKGKLKYFFVLKAFALEFFYCLQKIWHWVPYIISTYTFLNDVPPTKLSYIRQKSCEFIFWKKMLLQNIL